MNKFLSCVIALVILAAVTAGCAPPPAPVAPTHASFVLPTLIPPTKVPPTATLTPTATVTPLPPTPTLTATPVGTVTVTQVASQAPATPAPSTATPTPAATATPAPSPTSAIPPGVYVTGIRIDPSPVRGTPLIFLPTFLNSTEREQNYRWAVYIFRADNQRGIGETSRTDSAVPAGSAELASNGSWQWPLGGPCDYFYAQVGWLSADNKITWFPATNGSIFQKGFTACPP